MVKKDDLSFGFESDFCSDGCCCKMKVAVKKVQIKVNVEIQNSLKRILRMKGRWRVDRF